MLRKPLLLLPAAVLALAAPGCMPFIQSESASQQDLIGPVDVSAEVCETPLQADVVTSRSGRSPAPTRTTSSPTGTT